MRGLAATACLAAITAACTGQPAAAGLGEPIQVSGGQFIQGTLPGTPPLPIDDGGTGDGGAQSGPAITNISFDSLIVTPGQGGKSLRGRASGAASVAVRFADMGSGYWVVPVAEAEPQFPGENNFRLSATFDASASAGLHPLRFVAIDASGQAGGQAEISICIAGRIPDNLHSCSPAATPPAAVLSLQWDTNFDLDLHVLTPDGTDINPKAPIGAALEAGVALDPKTPRIDRDSLGSCVPDGLRQEDLVFPDPPAPGAYDFYVDPFAPCGQASVRFKLTLYQRTGTCPDCTLSPVGTARNGELLASQVTGGASPPLFISEFSF